MPGIACHGHDAGRTARKRSEREPAAAADGRAAALVRRGRPAGDRLLRLPRASASSFPSASAWPSSRCRPGSTSSCASAIPRARASAPRSPPPAGLRHPAARGAALSDGRHREPVHVPARRAGDRLGRHAAAAQHHRARACSPRRPPCCWCSITCRCPGIAGASFDLPTLYNLGLLASVLSGMIFLALYAWRLAKEARQMADALAATEMVLAREQQLHALDGLAAAAAHELGTPLSTIAVVAKELARTRRQDSQFAEDIALLQTPGRALPGDPEEADARAHRARSAARAHEHHAADRGGGRALSRLRRRARHDGVARAGQRRRGRAASRSASAGPACIYGLGNLVENAVDFARERVEIAASWSAREVVIDDRRRRARLARRRHGRAGRALHHDPSGAAAAVRQRMASRRAWALASSSPRPCWSARAPPSRWKPRAAGTRRHSARSAGRARSSRASRRPCRRPSQSVPSPAAADADGGIH